MEDKPNRAGQGAQTPITMAMRQAGEEAARKAGGMKPKDAKPSSLERAGPTSETLRKLDNSAPIPPPSGTTDAPSSAAQEESTSSGSKSRTPSTGIENMDLPKGAISKHRGSDVSFASAEEIRNIEQSLAITEEDEPEEESRAGSKSTVSSGANATSRGTDKDEEQNLPGSKTQSQPPASAEDAAQSVAD